MNCDGERSGLDGGRGDGKIAEPAARAVGRGEVAGGAVECSGARRPLLLPSDTPLPRQGGDARLR